MSSISRVVAAAVLSALVAAPSRAQRADDINGKLVRVTAPNFADHVVTGTVTAYTQEGLTVSEQGTGTEHVFPLRSVQRIDIFRGGGAGSAAPRRARSYGFVGLALGALTGTVIGIETDRDIATSGLIGAGGGLGTGLLLGALSGTAHPTQQWSWVVRPWGYDPNLRPGTR
jgi:hypothetical protein